MNKKSARCGLKKKFEEKQYKETGQQSESPALLHSPKRASEYQGHRALKPERLGSSIPIVIGAAMIAGAILLSTLITAVGTRFAGIETPSDEMVWLIDRLTGQVYKCQAPERGKAVCEAEMATGSIGATKNR